MNTHLNPDKPDLWPSAQSGGYVPPLNLEARADGTILGGVGAGGADIKLTGRRAKNRNMNKRRKRKSRRVFGNDCFYCGGTAESFDHFIPFRAGGVNQWYNLVPCCHHCNRVKKGKMPLPQWIEKHSAAIANAVAAGVVCFETSNRERKGYNDPSSRRDSGQR